MVCAKCAKLNPSAALATPAPKRKSEHYHGSAASTKAAEQRAKASASSGVGKSKLLGASAKLSLAALGANCDKCKTRVDKGRKLCQRCAYKGNACAMCGKSMTNKAAVGAGTVEGQKFSSK